jgi:site-specific recombinase XerD
MSEDRGDPKYRHYKPKDLAVVRIDGRDHYLGKYGSAESREKYHRLLAERHAGVNVPSVGGKQETASQGDGLRVNKLALSFLRHCENYYVKNGTVTSQVRLVRLSLAVLNRLFAHTLAADFGPLALETCQAEFVRQGLCRNECNRRTKLIRQAFRWGVSKQLIDVSILQSLSTVSPLGKGRTPARESAPVKSVPEGIVEAVRPHVSRQVWAMIEWQHLTGARPGEVVIMRTADINTSGAVWEYTPGSHKTEHHEHARTIFIGPQAQAVLKPWLKTELGAYLFSPAETEAEYRAKRRVTRKSPRWPSHVEHQDRKKQARRRKTLGDHYTPTTYRRAIARACDRAFPHPILKIIKKNELTADQRLELKAWRKAHRWNPNRLRHTAATRIRRRFGLEGAQAVLGHSELGTTQVYAEKNLDAARAIMQEVG